MKKRPVWFEYSWVFGLWVWPVTTEGWVVYIGGPLLALVFLGAAKAVEAMAPGSWLHLIPVGLALGVALVVNYLVITRMQRKGALREEEINHTARGLFGGQPWRAPRPKPLVPDRPPRD